MRRWVRTLGVATAAAAVAAAATAAAALWRPPPPAHSADDAPPATAVITRQTLLDVRTANGTLAYGAETAAESRLAGTLTWLPEAGATIRRGAPLFTVDDKPVVLLVGTLPAYRDLTAGRAAAKPPADKAPADTGAAAGQPPADQGSAAVPATTGADVRQFETNLRALGYTGFTVDEEYTATTAAAVKKWQQRLGLPPTGIVELGRVHYAAAAVRVAAPKLTVGQPVGGAVLTYTGTTRAVTAELKPHERGLAKRGAAVTIALPSGAEVAGAVASARPAPAEGGQGGEDALQVQIVPTRAGSLAGPDDGAVRVRFVLGARKNVLVVPVAALLALAGGGYGLEVLDRGASRIVPVTTGLFADGRVEISGPGVREGMVVGTA